MLYAVYLNVQLILQKAVVCSAFPVALHFAFGNSISKSDFSSVTFCLYEFLTDVKIIMYQSHALHYPF